MSLNTLEPAHTNGEVIDASHLNEITLALMGAFVGRNGTGVATPYQDLGTTLVPWGNFYARQLIIDGKVLDPAEITSKPNRIISGKTRSGSAKSDFIRANGAALSFTIQANAEDLVLSINDTPVIIGADIIVSGLTAAPSSNNSCAINEPLIPAPFGMNQTGGRYLGEDGDYIALDSMGSNVSSKIGQVVAFKTSYNDGSTTHTELLIGYLESSTRLKSVFRGFFFDSSGNPIERSNWVGNDSVLVIMSLGWVFIDVNGSTTEVSYKNPIYSAVQPSSGAAGDYWYDLTIDKWKRYSGSAWITVNRLLLGYVVCDENFCIAARSLDFDKNYQEENTIVTEVAGQYIVAARQGYTKLNVDAREIEWNANPAKWDLENDIIEMPNPTNPNDLALGDVYLYVKETGALYASTMKPYDRRDDLKGFYHPYDSHRCVGRAFIDIDWAGSPTFGLLKIASSFTFNPNVKNPVLTAEFNKPVNTNGGTNLVGSNNVIFNQWDNSEGAVNSINNDATAFATEINFARGEYEIDWGKVGNSVGQHRIQILDVFTGQVEAIGSMITADVGQQSEARLKAKLVVRTQALAPSFGHLTQNVGINIGFGEAMNAFSREVYSTLRITRLK